MRDPFAEDGVIGLHQKRAHSSHDVSNAGKDVPRAVDEADQLTDGSWLSPQSNSSIFGLAVPDGKVNC